MPKLDSAYLFLPLKVVYSIISKFIRFKKYRPTVSDFLGVAISFDRPVCEQKRALTRLRTKNLLFRYFLAEDIEKYIEYISKFHGYDILVVLIPHREVIENPHKAEGALRDVFHKFSKAGVRKFQIGNAPNRKKWGFFSSKEYIHFYRVAEHVSKEFGSIQIIGGNFIDFEFHFFIRFLLSKPRFDYLGSLLYVDRRGAPENRQLGFSLLEKIELLKTILKLHGFEEGIYITETNYPIRDMGMYMPTSNKEAVDVETYSAYMVRYILLALASGYIEKVYWHQLIAKGYGLISFEKIYPQYYALENLLILLGNDEIRDFYIEGDIYTCEFSEYKVVWKMNGLKKIYINQGYDIYGNYLNGYVYIGEKPIYIRKNFLK